MVPLSPWKSVAGDPWSTSQWCHDSWGAGLYLGGGYPR